jgi:hypothetical protein
MPKLLLSLCIYYPLILVMYFRRLLLFRRSLLYIYTRAKAAGKYFKSRIRAYNKKISEGVVFINYLFKLLLLSLFIFLHSFFYYLLTLFITLNYVSNLFYIIYYRIFIIFSIMFPFKLYSPSFYIIK